MSAVSAASSTLATYITGFEVSNCSSRSSRRSSLARDTARAGTPWSSAARTRTYSSWCRAASFSPLFINFAMRSTALSITARSARANSVLMTSTSEIGLMRPATCTISSWSKQRTTCAMASVSRICARNLLPRPSPCEAPATNPAMSTNSTVVGTIFSGRTIAASAASRPSGTGTMPTLGSMVQNG